ncbi:hypothetical protein D8S78_22360 [Natrialba swarupiae]|nr:hypothetical protein [Natrialba swarupiae]
MTQGQRAFGRISLKVTRFTPALFGPRFRPDVGTLVPHGKGGTLALLQVDPGLSLQRSLRNARSSETRRKDQEVNWSRVHGATRVDPIPALVDGGDVVPNRFDILEGSGPERPCRRTSWLE